MGLSRQEYWNVAIPFSRGSSRPKDWTWVSCIADGFFTIWATREAQFFKPSIYLQSLNTIKILLPWTCLVIHWIRICLSMRGTGVQSLSGKIPHALEQLSPCVTTTEPVLSSPQAATTEAMHLEPVLCNRRNHCNEKPRWRVGPLSATRES